jgi:hypothetical protein
MNIWFRAPSSRDATGQNIDPGPLTLNRKVVLARHFNAEICPPETVVRAEKWTPHQGLIGRGIASQFRRCHESDGSIIAEQIPSRVGLHPARPVSP